MRRQQNRLAERAQRPDHVPRSTPCCRIETGGRLVEEDEVRVADQRYSEVEPALLTAGKSLHARVSLLLEADELDHLVDVARPVVVTGEHAVRLGDGDRRPELRLLQHHADPLSEGRAGSSRIEAEDVDLAPVAGPVPLQDLDRGRLAGAVRAEETEDLALCDLEADPADRLVVTVGLPQAVDGDRSRGHPSAW